MLSVTGEFFEGNKLVRLSFAKMFILAYSLRVKNVTYKAFQELLYNTSCLNSKKSARIILMHVVIGHTVHKMVSKNFYK